MARTASKVRFKARLFRPAEAGKADSWMFLILPKAASAKLPSPSMTPIEGTFNGFSFKPRSNQMGKKAIGSEWTGS